MKADAGESRRQFPPWWIGTVFKIEGTSHFGQEPRRDRRPPQWWGNRSAPIIERLHPPPCYNFHARACVVEVQSAKVPVARLDPTFHKVEAPPLVDARQMSAEYGVQISVSTPPSPWKRQVYTTPSIITTWVHGIRPGQRFLSSSSPETNTQCIAPWWPASRSAPAPCIPPMGGSNATPKIGRGGGRGPTTPYRPLLQ